MTPAGAALPVRNTRAPWPRAASPGHCSRLLRVAGPLAPETAARGLLGGPPAAEEDAAFPGRAASLQLVPERAVLGGRSCRCSGGFGGAQPTPYLLCRDSRFDGHPRQLGDEGPAQATAEVTVGLPLPVSPWVPGPSA